MAAVRRVLYVICCKYSSFPLTEALSSRHSGAETREMNERRYVRNGCDQCLKGTDSDFIMTESRTKPTGDQLYRKRSVQRSAITRLISKAKAAIFKADTTDEEIRAISQRLDYESGQLRNTDRDLEPFLTGNYAEQEFMDTFEFRDIIITWQSILKQAMQCPRSELWGACLRYGRVASQFLARTKSCNFNCPSDAARANMPFQVTSGSLTASARIEDSSSQALIHETTPAATVQLEQKPQGLPAGKCAHPDVLLELDGQSNSEQN